MILDWQILGSILAKIIGFEMARFWALMGVAYLFGVVARLWWIWWASTQPHMSWAGELIINTNDGYYFGYLAKSGDGAELLSVLTAFISRVSGVSIESVMIYLSIFLSPLIVAPVMGIGRILGDIRGGFIAALLAVVAHSYYNRTMAGYFDTDMLNVVLAISLVWAMMRFVSGDGAGVLLALVAAYLWWYMAAASLILGYILVFGGYLAIYDRRFWTGWLVFGAIMIIWASFGGAAKVAQSVMAYLLEPRAELHFYGVMQTIVEAKRLDLWLWGERVAGSFWLAALGVGGWCWAVWRYRAFILSLPMMGLGVIALYAGLRFTIYAVPLAALGFGLVVSFLWQKYSGKIFAILAVMLSGAALTINLAHIITYTIPSIFTDKEIAALTALKEASNDGDVALAWWDYGYGVRYFTGLNILIDGAKHSGADNFAVSWALLSPIDISAKIARAEAQGQNSIISLASKHKISVDDALGLIKPQNGAKIFYYLPKRMIDIVPMIARFSRIDPFSGEVLKTPLWIVATQMSSKDGGIYLGRDMMILGDKISINGQDHALAGVIKTSFKDGKMTIKEHLNGADGLWVVMSDDTAVVMDKEAFNSAFVQLFMLHRWRGTPFLPVYLGSEAAVFELAD